MVFQQHNRTYDLVLFGASGYTGIFVAEHIATNLPTNLKWAIAGRSAKKLALLAADLKKLNPDRVQPAIETCNVNDSELMKLVKSTFVIVSCVGPFTAYGEPTFKACAENGTHYVDVTGEVPWVADMILKYETAAKNSGALMLPMNAIESVPADITTWAACQLVRERLHAPTADVTASLRLTGMPSGGTVGSVLAVLTNYPLSAIVAALVPYALSPIPKVNPHRGTKSWLSSVFGARKIPFLGCVTTSISGTFNAAQVERSWGLLASTPSRAGEAYGPNFSFVEYATTGNWLQGVAMHWALAAGTLLLATLPPVRWLVKRAAYTPGSGPQRSSTSKDMIVYRTLAAPDLNAPKTKTTAAAKPKQLAFVEAVYHGSMYQLTGLLAAEGALRLLEDDLGLEGGIYTSAVLGQKYVDRLDATGMKFEVKLVDV